MSSMPAAGGRTKVWHDLSRLSIQARLSARPAAHLNAGCIQLLRVLNLFFDLDLALPALEVLPDLCLLCLEQVQLLDIELLQ